ncbi:MAG: hypothetical protein EZS28_012751 [Streblomastix strix]|uniref:Uncharacterized protein n=1 Tax=Streblomastix strix TaxID=222440 RepID=A0A5J4W9X4_9EUKA|nr:MAG: hypothetical protein EZS28_012751 [Streblomastix strix]
MAAASHFNIPGGLMGIGEDLIMEVVSKMTSPRDLANFLLTCPLRKEIVKHKQFEVASNPARTDRGGTKVIVFRELPHLATSFNPNSTQENKEEVRFCVFDVLKTHPDLPTEQKRINTLAIIHKCIRIDDSSSFWACAIVYINAQGYLEKEQCSFPDLQGMTVERLTREWIASIELPPATITFQDIKSGGSIALALSSTGQLWTWGMGNDGKWSNEDCQSDLNEGRWVISQLFNSEDGLMQSSIGGSRISKFTVEPRRATVILQNGAVFILGDVEEFRSFWRGGQTWGNSVIGGESVNVEDIEGGKGAWGLLEITDSRRFVPLFSVDLRGKIAEKQGNFGIFGEHKISKYFKRMGAFLSDKGIIFLKTVKDSDRSQSFYTPLDPLLWFKGEGIVHADHHVRDAYVTESGKVYVIRGLIRTNEEMKTSLKDPVAVAQLPFTKISARQAPKGSYIKQLKGIFLTKNDHLTLLTDTGYFINLRYGNAQKDEEPSGEGEETTDEFIKKYTTDSTTVVTGLLDQITRDAVDEPGMIAKRVGTSAAYHFVLYE